MSQLIIDPFVVVFYLAPLNPCLILSGNYNCFITDFFLFFFFFRMHSTWFHVLGVMVAKGQLT